ncbi:RHS repeat-associated core domain-containing protein [Lysobacter sp. GX 14042]|uniref:RHS repeat-associated core domain-containing protein n=1 Tax=Lysobacter sp. GX 14042 TaxID=2907155 RepID=UPI001F28E29F|nr:RHS repeat-associated core domain-containing protein [Lysobacter sp. GX 14042]MCE7032881.1 RHS repeat-associated core domain-containing protein [Lysobacter sp. GX 14042]
MMIRSARLMFAGSGVIARILLALLCVTAFSTAAAQEVRYIHTDALGSVAVVTDANRNVIERREYEPYGAQLAPAVSDGLGYAGHVQDAATGLTYMQQRYYDPQIGRFLSVDPVTAGSNTGANFNRYWYANNNPYRFTDPDGRVAQFVWGAVIGAGVEVFVQTAIQGKSFSEIDVSDVAIAAGAGALTGGIASASALAAAKGTVTVGRAVAQTAAGSGAVGVNASLAGDVANGKAPDVGGALVEGAAAAALGAAGQRLTLGPTAALESMSNKGGLGAHIAETTRSANIGSDAAKVAGATSAAGSNAGQALTAAGTAAKAKVEEKLK